MASIITEKFGKILDFHFFHKKKIKKALDYSFEMSIPLQSNLIIIYRLYKIVVKIATHSTKSTTPPFHSVLYLRNGPDFFDVYIAKNIFLFKNNTKISWLRNEASAA